VDPVDSIVAPEASSVMSSYKNAGIKVFLFAGRTTSDYERMAKLNPYGVVVDNVAKFQAWRDSQTQSDGSLHLF